MGFYNNKIEINVDNNLLLEELSDFFTEVKEVNNFDWYIYESLLKRNN